MNGFGEWLQLSVFQCRLSRRRRAELETRLRELVKAGEDHVLLIDVGPAERTALVVESIGKTFSAIERQAVVIWIPPIVSDAGERARACCRDDSSGGAVRLDWGALDTALHTDSVRLFDIVKGSAATVVPRPQMLVSGRSKARKLRELYTRIDFSQLIPI